MPIDGMPSSWKPSLHMILPLQTGPTPTDWHPATTCTTFSACTDDSVQVLSKMHGNIRTGAGRPSRVHLQDAARHLTLRPHAPARTREPVPKPRASYIKTYIRTIIATKVCGGVVQGGIQYWACQLLNCWSEERQPRGPERHTTWL